MEFSDWLKTYSGLSDSSVYKYSHAVNTISNEMLSINVINKPIMEMELFEVDISIQLIFLNDNFIMKNTTGNGMYSNALKWYRSFIAECIQANDREKEEIKKIEENYNLEITERESIIKSRIGQGIFRELLLRKYGRCIVTGIDINRLLIASHIKPWAVSNNKERIDVNNGLLLSPTFDKLFDIGLLTFNPQGKILMSHFINKENKTKLCIDTDVSYNLGCNAIMANYLQYHNDMVFIK